MANSKNVEKVVKRHPIDLRNPNRTAGAKQNLRVKATLRNSAIGAADRKGMLLPVNMERLL